MHFCYPIFSSAKEPYFRRALSQKKPPIKILVPLTMHCRCTTFKQKRLSMRTLELRLQGASALLQCVAAIVAVCCSMLCNVLQCVAVCCSEPLQCCSVLLCAAVCCSVLQCVAVCCSLLQCVAVCCREPPHCCHPFDNAPQCVAVCCSNSGRLLIIA